MPLNRNLNVPCGCARHVISGPNSTSRPFPIGASTTSTAWSGYCWPHAQPLRSGFDELHQLRNGTRDADAAETIAELGGNRIRRRLIADELARVAAGARAASAGIAHRNAAVDEHEDVVLADQISAVERFRKDDLE